MNSAQQAAVDARRNYDALLASKAILEQRLARFPNTAPRMGSIYKLGNIFERLRLKDQINAIRPQLPAAQAAAAAAAAKAAQLAKAYAASESLGWLRVPLAEPHWCGGAFVGGVAAGNAIGNIRVGPPEAGVTLNDGVKISCSVLECCMDVVANRKLRACLLLA